MGTAVVYTDLDGTLLDHQTYSWAAAVPMLGELQRLGVPVVPCTSKTRAELEPLREAIGLDTPFIIENGAAVLIPVGSPLAANSNLPEQSGFRVKTFVAPREYWLRLVADAYQRGGVVARGFSEMTVDDIVALTGLSVEAAALAAEREYGEPLHWLVPPEERQTFCNAIDEGGGVILQGGRFAHVSGATDKGKALDWLQQQYSLLLERRPVSIAAGDSHNDVAMLEAADWALIVRSPVHSPPELHRREHVILSDSPGPEGWARGIAEILVQTGG